MEAKAQEAAAADLAFEAFTEALCYIQKELGISDGGRASLFWSDDREAQIIELLQGYAADEIESMEEE